MGRQTKSTKSLTDLVEVNREGGKELFNRLQGASPEGMTENEEMEHLG